MAWHGMACNAQNKLLGIEEPKPAPATGGAEEAKVSAQPARAAVAVAEDSVASMEDEEKKGTVN